MRKTIKSQILFGYLLLTLIPVIMTLVSIGFLSNINKELNLVNDNRTNQNATKDAIVGHYLWIMGLGDAINEGDKFTGSLDPTTCGLGKWMATVTEDDLKISEIATAMQALKAPHDKIHTSAASLVELSKVNLQAANTLYVSDIKPTVEAIIANITIITNKYHQAETVASGKLKQGLSRLIQVCLVLIVFAVILSTYIGTKIAKRISEPIRAVAEWTQNLALGHDTLDFNAIDVSALGEKNEVTIMIHSFKDMAQSVKNNVSVVKRVAEGDLTAFVDIRSSKDTLGQNLYHMVQTNDHMFADILHVASNVASSANEISRASAFLAQSTTEQAASVDQLSSTVSQVNNLSQHNTENVEVVSEAFKGIQGDVQHSTQQMSDLVTAVEEIRMASDRISIVIKSIEDIAFQTNILALNAAIEAARAGAAGKGFAVVADEVRQLAMKSSTAADETKVLIENTIHKTHYGASVAKETSETFNKISANIVKTVGVVQNIAVASKEQKAAIEEVHMNITQISGIAASNAAVCEESSAASDEMRRSADVLRGQMSKFNLRQRQYGKPYIPPEKENDSEFVAKANENYQKALEQGKLSEEKLLLK